MAPIRPSQPRRTNKPLLVAALAAVSALLGAAIVARNPRFGLRLDETDNVATHMTWGVALGLTALGALLAAMFGRREFVGLAAGGATGLAGFGLVPAIAGQVHGTDRKLLVAMGVLGVLTLICGFGAFGGRSRLPLGSAAAVGCVAYGIAEAVLWSDWSQTTGGIALVGRDYVAAVFPTALLALVGAIGSVTGRGGAAAALAAGAVHLPFAWTWVDDYRGQDLARNGGMVATAAVVVLAALAVALAPPALAAVRPSPTSVPSTAVRQPAAAEVGGKDVFPGPTGLPAPLAGSVPIAVSVPLAGSVPRAGSAPRALPTLPAPSLLRWSPPRPEEALAVHRTALLPPVPPTIRMEQFGPRWAPDPSGRYQWRYWDGDRWTERVADGTTETVDHLARGVDAR